MCSAPGWKPQFAERKFTEAAENAAYAAALSRKFACNGDNRAAAPPPNATDNTVMGGEEGGGGEYAAVVLTKDNGLGLGGVYTKSIGE